MPLGRSAKKAASSQEDQHASMDDTASEASSTSRLPFPLTLVRGNQGAARRDRFDSLSSRQASRDATALSSSNGSSHSTKGPTFVFSAVRPEDARAAYSILRMHFLREEVLPIPDLAARFQSDPDFSIGAYVMPPSSSSGSPLSSSETRRRLVGFISATVSPAPILQSVFHGSRSSFARVLCIHDLCVEAGSRHQGLGRRLMAELLRRVQERAQTPRADESHLEVIYAICPERRITFFEQFGFKFRCASHIQRGEHAWYEMRRFVDAESAKSPDTAFLHDDLEHFQAAQQTVQAGSMLSTSLEAMSTLSGSSSPPHGRSPLNVVTDTNMPIFGDETTTSPLVFTETKPPDALTQEQVMSFLLDKGQLSEQAARDLGLPSSAARVKSVSNPGIPFAKIFGQAIAGKTGSEDLHTAVISRVVDRKHDLNMHQLFCPNENCDCILLSRHSAEWSVRETGPLCDTLPVAPGEQPEETAQLPDSGNAPWLNSLFQTSSSPVDTIGPLRGFWHVPGPMGFHNVAFSRTVEWTVPTPSRSNTGGPRSNSAGSDDGPSSHSGRRSGDRERGSFSSFRSPFRPLEKIESQVENKHDEISLDVTPGELRQVKYIVCPDCGCGPLGFMILPREQKGDPTAASNTSQPCYVAAFRVRYGT